MSLTGLAIATHAGRRLLVHPTPFQFGGQQRCPFAGGPLTVSHLIQHHWSFLTHPPSEGRGVSCQSHCSPPATEQVSYLLATKTTASVCLALSVLGKFKEKTENVSRSRASAARPGHFPSSSEVTEGFPVAGPICLPQLWPERK